MVKHFGSMSPVRRYDGSRMVVLLIAIFLLLFGLVSLLVLYASKHTEPTVQTTVVENKVEPRTIEVLVPVQRIETGTKLDSHMFRIEVKAADVVGERVLKSFQDIQNMYARAVIEPGEPLRSDFVTKVKPANVITADIPEGFRAVTISVNATSSVEGWAAAGSHVDILWAHKVRGKPAVTVIVNNAKVLSAERQVEANVSAGMPVPSTVTLLVTAQDAQKIQLAQTAGSLNLQLRGDQNTGKGDGGATTITVDELVGSGPPVEQEPNRSDTIRIQRGDGGWDTFTMKGGKLVPVDE